jgi:hypothetical protein
MHLEANRGTGRWPPRRCDRPDLQGLTGPRALDLIDHHVLVKGGPLKTPRALPCVASFARLLDTTIREPMYACAALLASADPRPPMHGGRSPTVDDIHALVGNIPLTNSWLCQAGDPVEKCLNALRRTIVCARRIRRNRGNTQIPRAGAVRSDRMVNRRDTIRNVIEPLARTHLQQLLNATAMHVVRVIAWLWGEP